MDIEKQPKKAGELYQHPVQPPATRGQCRGVRRAFVKGALFVSVCLALKLFATHVVLPGDNVVSKPHHRHHRLNTEEREKLFLSVPNAESALEASRAYATHPHLAGSSEDLLDAKTILHLFQDEFHIHKPEHLPIYKAGSEESRKATLSLTDKHAPRRPTAWIDTYYPVMNTGLDRSLEILGEDGNSEWTADLLEDGDPRDEDAHKYKETIPSWHGLSAEGDVTGQLVYANYGRKEDYDELVAQGANLTGKVVLARYGANFRGLKIKGAQELGAAGVLIYSDPRDDGFVTTKNDYAPYPAGPARNPSSIQRGSVQFLSSYPGDPTTPGYPAYEDAERTEGSNIPKIPSLPISWANAQRLLQEIDNLYDVNKDGKKVLSGKASSKEVHMVNHVDTKVTPIWNTMAAIPGHIKNEVVVIGCHRDAWVLGAADPTSGTVSLHEIIRGFGSLLRHGWKPLRTVVIASWDAEEYGLIGSTEWGEDFAEWISDNVVAYLNVDVSVSGSRFTASASPSLAHLIQRTASDVPHPTAEGKTLWDAINDDGPYTELALNGSAVDSDFMEMYVVAEEQRKASKTQVHPLGSGSDFTVFLQRLGVASSDQGFGFTPSDPVYHYHSIYDSQSWQERYGDKGFHRHVAVAQHLGLLGLRLIDSIVVPLNTTQYALELDEYLEKVESLLPSLGDQAQEVHFSSLRKSIQRVQEASFNLDQEKTVAEEEFKKLLRKLPWGPRRFGGCSRRRGFYRKFADFVKNVFGVPPPTEEQLSRIHGHWDAHSWLAYLDESVDVEQAERVIMQHLGHKKKPHFPIRRFIEAAKRVGRANKRLLKFERGFISEGGIKEREWYKHLGVAPGKWLGYGATTFPALTEAITYEKDVSLINYEAERLEELLEKLADAIQPEAI
ncbi:Zn-dependent exopeptidase [Panaeolus papilionaceus]|nr:Zn-dependent exopeptidase [Panaeolus papilionaceus]